MDCTIRPMTLKDRQEVTQMMEVFYASEAVLTNGSAEIFAKDIDACVGDSPYAEGYILENAGAILGYAMLAKSFSTEYGKPCIWIEDLYIKEAYRGTGIGSRFLQYVTEQFPDCILRLEVEEENEKAIAVYRKSGFSQLPYMEMKK